MISKTTPSRALLFASLACAIGLAACGDDDSRRDAGPREDAASRDANRRDVGTDAEGQDAGPELDAPPTADAGMDAGPGDAGTDAPTLDASGPCRPFTELGCEAGQWCKPGDDDVSAGTCTNYGGQGTGAVCITGIDCASGNVCSGPSDASICELVCDPNSAQGSEANPCASGSRCANLRDEAGEPISLGICVPSCDYDGGVPCPGALTCQPLEIVSSDVDICLPDIITLPEQGDCALAGIPHGQLCGSNRICLMRDDLRPGRQCYAICRADFGRLNLANHPDCRDPSMLCQQFAVGLGVCL